MDRLECDEVKIGFIRKLFANGMTMEQIEPLVLVDKKTIKQILLGEIDNDE